jgi:hypothetical protein
MFISELEALERLRSQNNLLNRLAPTSKEKPHDEVDQALEEAKENPTFPSEDDAVRLAILAGRRHLRPSDQRGGKYMSQGNVPPIFRSLIGAAGKIGSVKGTAREWGVSKEAVMNYKNGKTHQNAEPNQSLISQLEDNTLSLRNQVLGLISQTVAGITPEKMENKDAKELSIIARNLSSIMQSTKPPADIGDKTTNAQVIVFSPEPELETSYQTTEVG